MNDYPELSRRMDRLEAEMKEELEKLEDLWRSSVDDIKNTITARLSDLKNEQIGDLKKAIENRERNMEAYELRLRNAEMTIQSWLASTTITGWIIKTVIAGGSLVAGYLGAKHIG